MKKTIILLSAIGIAGIANASEVFSVSDYEYTMNEKQAVSVSFGETQKNYCSATIYRSSIKEGYKVSSQQKSNRNISIDCNWGGKYYVQSSKHKTNVDFELKSINSSSKSAEIQISGKLVNPYNGKYFTLKNTPILVQDIHFDNLIKKM